ncbi:MAG: hypothetical protein O3B46_05885 [Bacteroidetes bacterium]|nr:hypothetical protein [Bacteroidota bacterium]MDA0922712.1 hypothetical protein [Bacteroidota bacterium]MDA1288949.1 hypothetical protein [Bacteroidota bacterium]
MQYSKLIILISIFGFLSCEEEDPIIEYVTVTETVTETVTVVETVTQSVDPFADSTLEGNITTNKILDANKIWLIKGRVVVTDGATLTIPAGTILKSEAGTGADASTLIIARGGKIDAQGTADKPIIFTSISDNILVDGTYPSVGSSLNVDSRGLWGGLLILGKAPCSFSGDVTELQIEGIPTSDINGLYGGTDPEDSSGTIKYVSIRHGGAEIGEGNEINGLTLGGVGKGTIIDNIEVIANVDDGIEFFGGTVDASNLLVWGQGDDALDIDQAYAGTIDRALVVLTSASDHGFEIDGPEGTAEGSFTLKNVTVYGATFNCNATGVDGEMADFRKGATGSLENILFSGFASGKDVELDASADAATYMAGKLTFTNIDIIHPLDTDGNVCSDVETLDKIFDDKTDPAESTFESDALTFAEIVTEKQNGNGVDESIFSWTFYSKNK